MLNKKAGSTIDLECAPQREDGWKKMKVIFDNETKITQGIVKEVCQKQFKKTNVEYRILVLVMAFIFLLFGVVMGFATMLPAAVALSVAAILMLFLYFKGYLLQFRQYYRALMKINEEAKIYYHFYENEFGVNQTIPYTEVTGISETEQTCILFLKEGFIFLEREGFIGVDYTGFKKFFREKCPDALNI